jgi:hypothetical protein
MAVPITAVSNQQELELEVSGPAPANRLFILTGTAQLGTFAPTPGGQLRETFTLLVGPSLTRTQFVRAIASAIPTDLATQGPSAARWAIPLVDADFDDDSGRTELRIEAELRGDSVMQAISFQVTILAAV